MKSVQSPHKKLLLPAFAAVACAVSANATIIHVDFGATSPDASLGSINVLATELVTPGNPVSIADLQDDAGNSTGITIELDPNGDNVANYASTIANAHDGPYAAAVTSAVGLPGSDAILSTVLGDGINVINSNDPIITIGNLDPSFTYELVLYNARGGGNAIGSWDYDVTDGTGALPTVNSGNILNSAIVTTFTDLTPDVNGEITAVLSKAENARGGLNYMQIVATPIPEPSSALLLGLSSFALLARRR